MYVSKNSEKQNLLGSQKCDLSIGVVSLQLSVILLDSLIHLGKLTIIFVALEEVDK